jgi:hypothetical protein
MSDGEKTAAAKAIEDLQTIASGGYTKLSPISAERLTGLDAEEFGRIFGEDFGGDPSRLFDALKGLGEIANGESEEFRELERDEIAFRKRFDAILQGLPELSAEDEAKLPPAPDYERIK